MEMLANDYVIPRTRGEARVAEHALYVNIPTKAANSCCATIVSLIPGPAISWAIAQEETEHNLVLSFTVERHSSRGLFVRRGRRFVHTILRDACDRR